MALADTDRPEQEGGGRRDPLATLAALLAPLALAKFRVLPGRGAPAIASQLGRLERSAINPFVSWLKRRPEEITLERFQKPGVQGEYLPVRLGGPSIMLGPRALAERIPQTLGHEIGHAYLDISEERVPPGMWELFEDVLPKAAVRTARKYPYRDTAEEALVRLMTELPLLSKWPYDQAQAERLVALRRMGPLRRQ